MNWTEECLLQICLEIRAIRTRLASKEEVVLPDEVKEAEIAWAGFQSRLSRLEDYEGVRK